MHSAPPGLGAIVLKAGGARVLTAGSLTSEATSEGGHTPGGIASAGAMQASGESDGIDSAFADGAEAKGAVGDADPPDVNGAQN